MKDENKKYVSILGGGIVIMAVLCVILLAAFIGIMGG